MKTLIPKIVAKELTRYKEKVEVRDLFFPKTKVETAKENLPMRCFSRLLSSQCQMLQIMIHIVLFKRILSMINLLLITLYNEICITNKIHVHEIIVFILLYHWN